MTDDLLESRLRELHDALDVAPLPPPVDRPVAIELDRATPARRRPRVLLAAAAAVAVITMSAGVVVAGRDDPQRLETAASDTTTSAATQARAEPVTEQVGEDGLFPGLAGTAWALERVTDAVGTVTNLDPTTPWITLAFDQVGNPSGRIACNVWTIEADGRGGRVSTMTRAACGEPLLPFDVFIAVMTAPVSYQHSTDALEITGPAGTVRAVPGDGFAQPTAETLTPVDATGLMPGLAGTTWIVVRFTDAAGTVSEPARGDIVTILSFSAEGNPSIQDGCRGWVATTDQGRRTVHTEPVACIGPGLWQPPPPFVRTLIQPDLYLADAASLRIAGPQGTVDAIPTTGRAEAYVAVGPDGLFPGLANTSWVVVRHVGVDGTVSAPDPADAPPTLSLSSTGEPSGTVGCNNWDSYLVTYALCGWQVPPGYYDTILSPTSYRVDPVSLHITGLGGTIHAAPA